MTRSPRGAGPCGLVLSFFAVALAGCGTLDYTPDLATNELKRKAAEEIDRKLGEGAGEALKKLFGD